MKRILRFLKNKYIITTFIFLIYGLFLDDTDVFSIFHNLNKQNQINTQNQNMTRQLKETKKTLGLLTNINYLETYARSKKFFKQENEDIFVISSCHFHRPFLTQSNSMAKTTSTNYHVFPVFSYAEIR